MAEGRCSSATSLSGSLGLRIGEMRGGEAQQRPLGLGLGREMRWGSLWQWSWCGEQLRMGEQPSTNGLSLQEATMSRGAPRGVKQLGWFLSAEPTGVRAACATIGEIVGEMRPAGEDLSRKRGLSMLPRLQSRKRPCWMGLEEN